MPILESRESVPFNKQEYATESEITLQNRPKLKTGINEDDKTYTNFIAF